jgi:phage gp36-like protein
MTYATQSDLTDRFGAVELAQLTDRTNGVVIDATVLGRALTDADAEIDSYLATRYALPLASTPVVLVRMAADIARYRLYDDRVTEAVRQRYADAVSLLKRMATGEVQLAGSTALPAATTGAGNAVAVIAPDRVFSATSLQNY